MTRRFTIVAIATSFLGFVDATYLTLKHYLGQPVTCSLLHGCEQVTTSVFATVGPIPIALFGSAYYLLVLLLLLHYLDTKKQNIVRTARLIVSIAFLVSLVLLYLQAFVIHAFCLYCLFSLTTTTILFFLFMFQRSRSLDNTVHEAVT